MPQEIVHLSTRNIVVKLLLVVLLLAASVWSYYVVRWYIGNTLAEYFNPAESNLRVAEMAASLAPNDALTHWRVAQVQQKTLPLDQQAQALTEYEKAISLSPNDYRFWMALGTASEQAGDAAKAERALKQAVTLAPAYAYPHWYLGNLYLRSGRYDEAFAELRTASEADPELQPQQFNLVWEIHGSDAGELKKAVGDNAVTRAKFALYLIGRQKYDEGLQLWNGLSDNEKRANRDTGEGMVNALVTAFHYHDAVRVWNDFTTNERFRMEIGRVFDGGFEEGVAPEGVFGWQVKTMPQVQIGIDESKTYEGSRSLRLTFHVRTNIENINIAQLVPVATKTNYDFGFAVATDKLETGGPPLVQIVDPTTSAVLASSPVAANGTSDWTYIGLSFKTGDKTEAVMIRIVRPSCGTQEAPVCPIFGSVWYDNFSLKRAA
jgi:tetratricopeptide repeat protein